MLQKLVPQGLRINLAILLKEKLSDFEIVLAHINPGNEEILNLENLEPTSNTNEAYTQICHYQKRGYSVQVMEQKPRKVSEKNVANKSLQTDSKVSIFRRKEIMDENEQINISPRTSTVTPLKKQLQSNSPQLQDQESYCNQQPVACQPLPPPKSFQEGFEQEIIFPEETEIKKACVQDGTEQVEKYDSQQIKTQVTHQGSQDINRLESQHSSKQAICVSNLPNKTFSQGQPLNKERICFCERARQMISSYQQTSFVWGPETLSELLLPFHQSIIPEKETLSTETLLAFSGASEMKPVLQESQCSIQQPEEQESRRGSRSVAVQGSLYNIQEPKIFEVQQESQLGGQQVGTEKTQSEEKKPKRRRKIRKIKIDQAQQTDSVQSMKREFFEKSLQTDTVSIANIRTQLGMQEPRHDSHQYDLQKTGKPVISDPCIDNLPQKQQDFHQVSKPKDTQEFNTCSLPAHLQYSIYDSQHSEVQEFHHSFPVEDRQVHHSRPLAGLKEFELDSHQLKKKDDQTDMLFELKQKSQHDSLGTENKIDDAKEPHGTISSEDRTMPLKQKMSFGQQTCSIISLEEATWLNRRSGKLMQNQSQQTNDSWLQNYREKKQKLARNEALSKNNEPGVQKSQRISSESWTNKQYTALETGRSREQSAVLESHEHSKRSPSLESQRSSKQPVALEIEKASESTEVSATLEFQKGNEKLTLSESPKATDYATPSVYPVSESEKCTAGKSLRTSEETQPQMINEPSNTMPFHRTNDQPLLVSESKTSELFHEKWEANEPSLLKSQEAMEFSNIPYSHRVSAPPSITYCPNTSEPSNMPQARRATEALIAYNIPEPILVCEFQKAVLPPISESQRDNEQPISSEFEMGSEYPPLLDFRKGSEQLAIPELPESNEQPICPESQKFDEPTVSESQNNSEQPIIPEFQRDSDHPYELEPPKGSEELIVSEFQKDSKQPAISEPQRTTEPVIECKCRRDILKPYTSESRRCSEQADINDSKQNPSCASKAQQTYSIISVGSNIWKNRRTGKLMTCSSQQTERSWLQEHRARKVNLTPKGSFARNSIPKEKETELDKIHLVENDRKEIIAQQEKLLQSQKGHLQEDALIDGVPKPALLASRLSGQEIVIPKVVEYCQPCQHADLPCQRTSQQPEVTTSQQDSLQTEIASKQVSQQAVIIESQQASKEAEVPESQQASQKTKPSQQAEDISTDQTSQQQEVIASEQERMALQISSKLDVEQELHQGSKESVQHEFHSNDILWSTPSNDAQQSYQSPSRSTLDSSSSYVEGENKALQTYSRISLENGIWLNRKTGKVLINHSQQTSISLLSKRALENSGNSAGCLTPPISDVKLNEAAFDHQSCSSCKLSEVATSSLSFQQSWDEIQSIDEVEKVLISHVSTDVLSAKSLSYVEVEYDTALTYDSLSLPKGSWINLKTGKMLVSQYQQTDESSFRKSKEDIQPVHHPSYTPEQSYDLNDRPVNEGSQQNSSNADYEAEHTTV